VVSTDDHDFCDSCPLCRPTLMSLDGEVMPDEDPIMQKVYKIWDTETTLEERRAFILVSRGRSHKLADRRLARKVAALIQKAF
jgi:hypothetical protein